MCLPQRGSLVYYFPQGHSEQVLNPTAARTVLVLFVRLLDFDIHGYIAELFLHPAGRGDDQEDTQLSHPQLPESAVPAAVPSPQHHHACKCI